MDFAQVLNELWRRRGWVAIGAGVALFVALSTAYHIGFLPPSLREKSLSIGTADTQILVDSPESALTDIGREFDPLSARAVVFARFMTSRPVRAAIAREVGLNESQIITEAPLQGPGPRAQRESPAARRGNELLGENLVYRLRFTTEGGVPTITIDAQAPRAEDAVRLANAAAVGFSKYVSALEKRQNVPPRRRVQVRQLGSAEGGTVAETINGRLAALAFFGALIGWCLLILLVSTIVRSMRELNESESSGPGDAPTPNAS